MANENIPSNNPRVKRRKKVLKELEQLLVDEGYTGLSFGGGTTMRNDKRWALKRTRIVQQAIELGLNVPQALIDEVDPPVEPNPPAPPVDLKETPF